MDTRIPIVSILCPLIPQFVYSIPLRPFCVHFGSSINDRLVGQFSCTDFQVVCIPTTKIVSVLCPFCVQIGTPSSSRGCILCLFCVHSVSKFVPETFPVDVYWTCSCPFCVQNSYSKHA